MNVLCIAPHPDDEAIGCGGALALHADKGDAAAVVFLTSGELGLNDVPKGEAWGIREDEARRAAKLLGITRLEFLRLPDGAVGEHIDVAAERIHSFAQTVRPELVYVPHPLEWHPDHKAAVAVAQTCRRLFDAPLEVRGYEIWTPIPEHDHALDITSVWERKLAAVRAHASQMKQWPYERALQGLNQYRGAMNGRCDYAEVFRLL